LHRAAGESASAGVVSANAAIIVHLTISLSFCRLNRLVQRDRSGKSYADSGQCKAHKPDKQKRSLSDAFRRAKQHS
jgi:cytochrome c biogenesis protein ResB